MEKGNLVRYVGAQQPKLAGMEGELVMANGALAKVAWKYGNASMPEYVMTHELKKIRSYSKRFR